MVTLGGPWIDETAVIEAVDDQAGGVTQHHVACVVGKHGAAEPLIGRRSSLIASSRDDGVAHNRVDHVIPDQGFVESDAGAERLNGFIARVRKSRCRLEADSRSSNAEG